MSYRETDDAYIKVSPTGVSIRVDYKKITLQHLERMMIEDVDIDFFYEYGGDWTTDGYQCYHDTQLIKSSYELSALIDAYNLVKYGKVMRPDRAVEIEPSIEE